MLLFEFNFNVMNFLCLFGVLYCIFVVFAMTFASYDFFGDFSNTYCSCFGMFVVVEFLGGKFNLNIFIFFVVLSDVVVDGMFIVSKLMFDACVYFRASRFRARYYVAYVVIVCVLKCCCVCVCVVVFVFVCFDCCVLLM